MKFRFIINSLLHARKAVKKHQKRFFFFFFNIFFLFSLDATAFGGHECTWGPAFWCQSKIHAHACGTTQHCEEHVWNNWKFSEKNLYILVRIKEHSSLKKRLSLLFHLICKHFRVLIITYLQVVKKMHSVLVCLFIYFFGQMIFDRNVYW